MRINPRPCALLTRCDAIRRATAIPVPARRSPAQRLTSTASAVLRPMRFILEPAWLWSVGDVI